MARDRINLPHRTSRRVGRGSSRLRALSLPLVALALLGAFTTSCAPPPAPPWIGVQWARDTGGTTNPTTGEYTGAWGRYLTSGGSTTGPTASGNPLVDTPSPLYAGLFGRSLPDGTARFPWNGYAGEGISVTGSVGGPYIDYTAHFPGGNCLIHQGGSGNLLGAMPSPDGRFIAVTSSNNDMFYASASAIKVLSLTPTGCPLVTAVSYFTRYVEPGGWTGESISNPTVAWSPNSEALAYALNVLPQLNGAAAIVRLDAAAGSVASPVLSPETGCTSPLGWSIENRILLSCLTLTGPSSGQSRIISIPLGAGTTNVIDTFTAGPGTVSAGFAHYGYYAPGTTTIVFNKAVPVVNGDGFVQPWYQVHTVYDLPFATSSPLLGFAPPFGWHQEKVPSTVFPPPPPTFTDVPNAEVIERWYR